MESLESFVDKYFEELGIKRYKNILQFWSALDEEYGLTRARQLESAYIKLEEGDEESFYSMIFEEFDVALAFSSLRIDLYKAFLKWLSNFLEKENKKDATILDIGCGNGTLTCLIAKSFPETKITGFDISKEGIACAEILKRKLGLENVSFAVTDVKNPSKELLEKNADLAISIASLDPEPGSRFDTNLSLKAKWSALTQREVPASVNSIKSMLREDGIFISFDKVVTVDEQMTWINALDQAGLHPDFEASSWLTYQDIQAESITLPVLVTRTAPENSGALNENVMAAFLMSRNFSLGEIALDEKQEVTAELTFTYLNPKTFLKGARADYKDGTGSVWHEVWQAGPVLLSFEHTNHGYRGLKLEPCSNFERVIKAHERWIESSENYADIKTLNEPEISFDPIGMLASD